VFHIALSLISLQRRTSMDHIHARLEALEQRTHTVERQLRWWRGVACGLLVLAVLTWALPLGQAADAPLRMIADEVAALRDILTVVRFDAAAKEVVITGANLRLVNGLGATDTTNGLGNLIVGYNEPRSFPGAVDTRTGSHNVVVGSEHNFSSFGGLVVGLQNEILGAFASISGGQGSRASGLSASVSGGSGNWAMGDTSSVSGGRVNIASGLSTSVSGGFQNIAGGLVASVSGGEFNSAPGNGAAVSGGNLNTASGELAAVSGGALNTASGNRSSVSGGGGRVTEDVMGNTASGDFSSVSGGRNRTAAGEFDWVAGRLSEDE
jgi:hypothetical protein